MTNNLPWVRVKRHYYALATEFMRAVHHVSQNLLMSTMHPVKRPDGDNRIRNFYIIFYIIKNFQL